MLLPAADEEVEGLSFGRAADRTARGFGRDEMIVKLALYSGTTWRISPAHHHHHVSILLENPNPS